MSPTDYASLCGDSADCVAELTSQAAQITHWQVAGSVFLGVLLLVVGSIGLGHLILDKRRAKARRGAGGDVENGQDPTWTDSATSLTQLLPCSIEDRKKTKSGVRLVTIKSRKPKRMLSTLYEKIEADGEDEYEIASGFRHGIPAEWFELADNDSDEVVIDQSIEASSK